MSATVTQPILRPRVKSGRLRILIILFNVAGITYAFYLPLFGKKAAPPQIRASQSLFQEVIENDIFEGSPSPSPRPNGPHGLRKSALGVPGRGPLAHGECLCQAFKAETFYMLKANREKQAKAKGVVVL